VSNPRKLYRIDP